MAPRKRGIITQADAKDHRQQAIIAGEKAKKALKGLHPYRMDYNTVIFINPDQDTQKQVSRYRKRLEMDRMNY